MWPFSRKAEVSIPSWVLDSPADEKGNVQFSCGTWIISDGARIDNSIRLGTVVNEAGSFAVKRDENGIQSLELRYRVRDFEDEFRVTEIVIDSGVVVVCCEDSLRKVQLDNKRLSYRLLRSVQKQFPRSDLVLAKDASAYCVAIFALPPWGDGAYRVSFQHDCGLLCISIELHSSM